MKEVTIRDLSNAYCSVAEIYLTDAWFVSVSVVHFVSSESDVTMQ